jgi:hypothetical protein
MVPKKGLLHLGISESWNQGAPSGLMEYFSSVTCDSLVIGGIEVDKKRNPYECTYYNEDTDRI